MHTTPDALNWMRLAAPRKAMGRIRMGVMLWLQNCAIMGLLDPFTHFVGPSGSELSGCRVARSVRPKERRMTGVWMKMNLL